MGKRGPQPKPTALHILQGTYRKDRHSNELQPATGAPDVPKSLTKEERLIWDRVCKEIQTLGLLYKIDGWQIERYAKFFCRWRKMEAFIAKNGISYESMGAVKEFPEVKETHRLDKAMKQIEQSFGLQPSARSRITKPTESQQPKSLSAFKPA